MEEPFTMTIEPTTVAPLQPDELHEAIPGSVPVEPAPVTPDPTAGEEIDWQKRYNGQQRAIQLAVEAKQSAETALLTKASELEQLQAQLTLKESEKTIAVGERDKQVEALLQESQSQTAELTRLKSLEAKLKVANKLGKPELMKLADHIPNLTDEQLLENVMKDFASFGDEQVKAREDQLMAGISPSSVAPSTSPAKPSTAEGWEQVLGGMPHGKEKDAVLKEYGDFLESSHNTKI